MQSSSMLKRRPPPQARRPHSPSGDRILPVHHERNDGDGKSRRRQKSRRRILFSNILRLTAVVVIALLLLVLAFDESLVYWSISSFPMESYQDRSDLVSLDNANTAVISIHEGFKYHGSLGRFLRENKRSYAITHGYAFVDTFPDEGDLLPLDPWQIDSKSAFHYKKMRFVLHEMEQYTNLEWILWVDSDTIFTQQHVGIEDRTDEFEALHSGLKSTADDLGNPSDICVVWAKDPLPDEGVLLFRNSVTARSMLRTSLQTDKASLTVTVERNNTYRDCQLSLENADSTLLQGRVRGRASWLWRPGQWIVHFPDHTYLELLNSLREVSSKLKDSPAPVFPPVPRPDLRKISTKRKFRFEAVQDGIRHAWFGYADACLRSSTESSKRFGSHIPLDDLSPLSDTGHDCLHHAATLHDSLDTLALAFGEESKEYKDALAFLLRQDLQATALQPTKVFEYSLRILGGLLGAFSVTGDVRLLSRAKDAADSLLQSPFASSPTALPRMYDVLFPPRGASVLYKIFSRVYQWGRDAFTEEHHSNSLAGVGSFALEFYFISQALGVNTYSKAADDIFLHVAKYQRYDGIVPSFWDVMTGEPSSLGGGLGSGSDSFYEYLIKVPLLACTQSDGPLACDDKEPTLQSMLALYRKVVEGSLRSTHVFREKRNGDKDDHNQVAYPVEYSNNFHHLLCFLPGMVALGAVAQGVPSNNELQHAHEAVLNGSGSNDLVLAGDLLRGCQSMYTQTKTGIGPEMMYMNTKSVGDGSYQLRPEFVESVFILYRLTGREEYQEMGWSVFESLEHYCRMDSGYGGLKDVNDEGRGKIDDMPSYFIAETLKYLLLLFGPDDFVSLDEFVFTTEAHPMRRLRNIKSRVSPQYYTEAVESSNITRAPFPWVLFGFVLAIATFVLAVVAAFCACLTARFLRGKEKKR